MNENSAAPSTGGQADSSTDATTDSTDSTPEMAELEADIARTREELADTVDQLSAKLDVKSRVRDRATQVKDRAGVQVRTARQHVVGVDGKPRPAALGVGGGVLAAVAAMGLVRWWMRPARSRHRRWRRR